MTNFKSLTKKLSSSFNTTSFEAIVIGSGMAGITAASLLAKAGLKVAILEQNWLPGGCSSAYPRKGYVFESGATTLVGLDSGMPLHYLLQEIGISINAIKLNPPMKVYLPSGNTVTRFQDLNQWIAEAQTAFGMPNQREFWEKCYQISQFVWQTSLKQRTFPPSSFSDIKHAITHLTPAQLRFAPYAFQSMDSLVKKYKLNKNKEFVAFLNEQLLITAQNYLNEVNVLFGATALCYTHYNNYYVHGGLINLINPFLEFLKQHNAQIHLRTEVTAVSRESEHYLVQTNKGTLKTKYLISSIPINNTLTLFDSPVLKQKYKSSLLESPQLNSAFSLGFVAQKRKKFESLHHQIHLPKPLPTIHSPSIFLSVSHPEDSLRCPSDCFVGSISTHVHDPQHTFINDKEVIEKAIFSELERKGLLKQEDIIFHHSSTPKSWKKWTGRAWGFVGGYPQFMKTKPWQMIDARLDHKRAYVCGDSTYPGQGIPGACLSGIIAFQKLKNDWL